MSLPIDTNLLANFVERALRKRKSLDEVELTGYDGREGVGILFEAVRVKVEGKTFLIEVREVA